MFGLYKKSAIQIIENMIHLIFNTNGFPNNPPAILYNINIIYNKYYL